jgi:predicted HicB family RNase H-like nuclease
MTQIGLRTPEELSEKLESKAKEVGISKNALILILIDLGLRVYEREHQSAASTGIAP